MPLYRAYPHPDKAPAYGPIKIDAQPKNMKYSQRLRAAVLHGAGPQPDEPSFCPRCRQMVTFNSWLCYKYSVAGAWNMAVSLSIFLMLANVNSPRPQCKLCKQVHFPPQNGPSEEDLELIKEIQSQDQEAFLAEQVEKAHVHADKPPGKDKKKCMHAVKAEGAPGVSKNEESHACIPTGRPNTELAAPQNTSESRGMDGPCPFGVSKVITITLTTIG